MANIKMGGMDREAWRAMNEMDKAQKEREQTDENTLRPKFPHCPNCGAPLKSTVCEYCGAEWLGLGLKPQRKGVWGSLEKPGKDSLDKVPDIEGVSYTWLEELGELKTSGPFDDKAHIVVVVETLNETKALYRGVNIGICGITVDCDEIAKYIGKNTQSCVKIDRNKLDLSIKSVKVYIVCERTIHGEQSNFGLTNKVVANEKGFGVFDLSYDITSDFAIANCILLFTLEGDRVTLNTSESNFETEVRPYM